MKKIVLIDDHDGFRDLTASILEMAAYEVVTAADGKTGIELTRMIQPDLVLSDVMMPDIDGVSLVKVLGASPVTAGIPVILLSARNTREDIRRGMNSGADDYLTKPFNQLDLIEAIEARLQKKHGQLSDDSSAVEAGLKTESPIQYRSNLLDFRREKHLGKKEKLFQEGDYAHFVYFLLNGRLKTVKNDSYGKELLTEIYLPGNFLGYLPLEEHGSYQETAYGMEPSIVKMIPRNEFLSIVKKDINASEYFNSLLADRAKENEERMLQLAYASVRERLATALLKFQVAEGESSTQLNGVTRDDLANLIGTTKESLVRTLAELKKEGSIQTQGKSIAILDEVLLRKNILAGN